MKFFLTAVLMVSSLSAQAFFERKVFGLVSSHPEGVVLSAGLAYNQKLWDDSETTFWKYGFIRPKIAFDTSFLVNILVGEIQIYPISLVGLSFGTNYGSREVKRINDFDCDIFDCSNDLQRDYYRVNVNLGAGDFISSLSYQAERLSPRNTKGAQTVELATLLLMPNGEISEQQKKIVFIGYKLSDEMNFGVLAMQNELSGRNGTQKSEGQYVVASMNVDKLKYMAGVGAFGSDYDEKRFSLLVKINWLLDPSLSLND